MGLALMVLLDGESTSSCHTGLGAPTTCQHPLTLTHPELCRGSSLYLHRDLREWISSEQNKHFVNSRGSELGLYREANVGLLSPPRSPLHSELVCFI